MKPELVLLLWAVVLTFVQMLVAVTGATLQLGLPALASNRDGVGPFTGWVGRAYRAHNNMLESLVLFAALVLIAVLSQKTNSMTMLGAQLFVWARAVYALVYLCGVPWLRTGIWLISVVGLALIFCQLIA